MLGRLAPLPLRLGGINTPAGMLASIKSGLGSAFTQENNSYVGAENIAQARLFAALNDCAERIVNNATPAKSTGQALLTWANRLGVNVPNDCPEHLIRALCMDKYTLIAPMTYVAITDLLREKLGSIYKSIRIQKSNDLDNAPYRTVSSVDDLPVQEVPFVPFYWFSSRCQLLILYQYPDNYTTTEVDQLLSQTSDLLNILLPSWVDFVFSEHVGYILDISELDATAVTNVNPGN